MHQEAAVGHEVVAGNPHAVGFILGHNLLTGGLMGFLAPVTLGVAGGLITLINGFVVGYVGGVFAGFGHLGFFACGILPHGVFELPALVLASAFALRIGATMVRPSPDGWLRGVGLALTDYLRGMVVIVTLFAIAAVIEAYLTPGLLSHC
jgi:stage II sporulation protein M